MPKVTRLELDKLLEDESQLTRRLSKKEKLRMQMKEKAQSRTYEMRDLPSFEVLRKIAEKFFS